MENLCRKFISTKETFVVENCLKLDKNINKYAKKFNLTIFLNDGKLHKSKRYGKEMFVIFKGGVLRAHENPGKLAKLPAGVNKVKGCIFALRDIIKRECESVCDINTDWRDVEKKFGVGINIWRKVGVGLNKTTIENVRRTTMKSAINLHCDKIFNKVYLITCDRVYFRGHRHLIN